MENLLPWLSPTIAGAAFLYTVAANRGKAANDRVAKLETEVAALRQQVLEVSGNMRHLPDKDMSHSMALSLSELKGQLQVLAERLQPVAAISERLQEFLLEQARR